MQTLEFVMRMYEKFRLKTWFNREYRLAKTEFMNHWHVVEK